MVTEPINKMWKNTGLGDILQIRKWSGITAGTGTWESLNLLPLLKDASPSYGKSPSEIDSIDRTA